MTLGGTSAGCLSTHYICWEACQNEGKHRSWGCVRQLSPVVVSAKLLFRGRRNKDQQNGRQSNVKIGGKLIGVDMLLVAEKISNSHTTTSLASFLISSSQTRTFKLFINAKKSSLTQQNIISKQKSINLSY
ncbi:hypothetical protein IGI04_035913 [Brassica rapa subsp. trilocularis]|uniref:Uncharacterized protein n=1 Tax=Brassica rapa subsp. trilocularis TaxID=1813537 RepID=A0ABQ7LD47_BRACM|nr:hypothetical protein IGI04_035913 [Brassica rapa subsp. trilocularis]